MNDRGTAAGSNMFPETGESTQRRIIINALNDVSHEEWAGGSTYKGAQRNVP
jgi:hypothetical protein